MAEAGSNVLYEAVQLTPETGSYVQQFRHFGILYKSEILSNDQLSFQLQERPSRMSQELAPLT